MVFDGLKKAYIQIETWFQKSLCGGQVIIALSEIKNQMLSFNR